LKGFRVLEELRFNGPDWQPFGGWGGEISGNEGREDPHLWEYQRLIEGKEDKKEGLVIKRKR
jgi:hypothetical protein